MFLRIVAMAFAVLLLAAELYMECALDEDVVGPEVTAGAGMDAGICW